MQCRDDGLVVRHGDDRAALVAQRREKRDELGPRARVLTEGRLVENEHARRRRERGGDREAPLLATGQRVGVRACERREPQPFEQFVGAGGDLRIGRTAPRSLQRAGPDLELVPNGRAQQLMLRVLEHRSDAGQEVAGAPPDRAVASPGIQRLGGYDFARGGGQEPRECERQRRLARAVGARDRERGPRSHVDVEPRRDRHSAHARDGEAAPVQQHLSRGVGRGGRQRGRDARNPDPRRCELRSAGAEHGVRRAVGDDAVRAEDDHAVHERQPDVDPVLHDDEGGARGVEHASDRVADLRDARGVEVRGRFVEEQESRSHRERAGERQALLLPAGERLGRAVQGHVQTHGIQGVMHPRPDLLARDAEVLAPERDVIAHPREDHLRVGVLKDETGATARRDRRLSVDEQLTTGFALLISAENSRKSMEERRLARAGGAQQEHTLAGLDPQVDAVERPRPPRRMPPPPPPRGDARGGGGGGARCGPAHPVRRGRAARGRTRSARALRSRRCRARGTMRAHLR